MHRTGSSRGLNIIDFTQGNGVVDTLRNKAQSLLAFLHMLSCAPDGIEKIFIGIGLDKITVCLKLVAFYCVVDRGGAENYTSLIALGFKLCGDLSTGEPVHINVEKHNIRGSYGSVYAKKVLSALVFCYLKL